MDVDDAESFLMPPRISPVAESPARRFHAYAVSTRRRRLCRFDRADARNFASLIDDRYFLLCRRRMASLSS